MSIQTAVPVAGDLIAIMHTNMGDIKIKLFEKEVPNTVKNFVELAKCLGFHILGLTFSPVKGPEGNIEFLAHLTLADKPGIEPDTAQIVADAHNSLKG